MGERDKKYTVSINFEIYLEKSYIDGLESISSKSAQMQQVMVVRVASSSRLKTEKVGDRLEQAAPTEDMRRLALESQQQHP